MTENKICFSSFTNKKTNVKVHNLGNHELTSNTGEENGQFSLCTRGDAWKSTADSDLYHHCSYINTNGGNCLPLGGTGE